MSALENLSIRIEAMDWRKPYVWRLKISASEFAALETAVAAGGTTARQNIVYLAEWYKRCYDGGAAKPVRTFDAKELFETAGIDKANLFKTEGGQATWQYSIYVFGGVAMAFECAKRNARFLKGLCKVFYGEDEDLGSALSEHALSAADPGRAVAFRESVRTHGCLYEYLQAILSGFKSGELPFAAEDLADENSQAKRFLERVKRANDEVLKSKFDLEWVVGFDPYATHLTRKLRLRLRPETVGGLNHRYLGYERVRQWNIAPETCRRLVVGVRFLLDGATVAEPDFARPLLDFLNTGTADAGFVAWSVDRYSRQMDAPVSRFDEVVIVVREDSGREHDLDSEKVDEWMQVFRVPGDYNAWSTTPRLQQTSAVICPAGYEMLDVGATETIYERKFRAKGSGVSESYRWRFVNGTVRFKDLSGEIVTVYNRQGHDEVSVRLHNDILRYHDGCVSYTEEREDEVDETWLPIVFGKDDVFVRHYASGAEGDAIATETPCEKIEFFDGRGYREWTETEAPEQGKARLRVTVKGEPKPFRAYYLPSLPRRDCDKGEIILGDTVVKDDVRRDGRPTDPVCCKMLPDGSANYVVLEIWRPTKHKEIIRNGRVVRYVEEGETAEISYALKDGLTIRGFSAEGYREYDCGDIGNAFALPEFSEGCYAALTNQYREQVRSRLDPSAPEWLWLNLTSNMPGGSGTTLLYWNYHSNLAPQPVDDAFAAKGDDIVFQTLKEFEGCCVQSPRIGKSTPFSYARVRAQVDIVRCFEVATEHGVYYAAMLPFRQPNLDFRAILYEPLLEKTHGMLTKADLIGLRRLAEEFGFDWRKDHGIVI